MTNELIVSGVWPDIKRAAATAGPRFAAIAFIGKGAFDSLLHRFGSRDVLVVNASDAALKAHATSPTELRRFVNKGVSVWSVENLHAKVIATASHAIVGSANASRNSELSQEAAIISTQASVITGIVDFVTDLEEVATAVDADFLERAEAIWDSVKLVREPAPGVNGKPKKPGHLPRGVKRLGWSYTRPVDYSKAERDAARKGRATARKKLQNVMGYRLDTWSADGEDYSDGDVVVLFNERRVWPPAVVVAATPVTGRRGLKMYTLRYEKGKTSVKRTEATERLKTLEIKSFPWDEERWISDKRTVDALLGLWSEK